ncbi:hypothetical protein BDB13_4005 [Rhodococcus sp. OK302]|nr:hypothetical protein BDB13_4005 [Rhodococcus sp. OK302]
MRKSLTIIEFHSIPAQYIPGMEACIFLRPARYMPLTDLKNI